MSSKKSSTSAKGTAEVPSATAPVANNTAAVKAKTLHAFFVRNNPSPAPSADPSTIEIHTPSPVGLTVTTEISPSHIASTSTPVDLVTPCNKGDQIDTKNEEEQPDVADASSSALVSDANPNTPVVESKASESVPSSQNAPSSSSTSNSNPKAPLFALFQKKKAAPSGSAVPTSTKETETEEISPPQPTEEVAESKASSEKAEEIIDDNEEAETENVNKEDEAIESSAFPRKRNRELDRLAKKCRGEEDAINVFDSTVEQNGKD